MCGRFANQQEGASAWDAYFDCENSLASIVDDVTIGYNIAPTQMIPIITKDGWLAARWGMIGSWVKDASEISSKFATFNARSETVSEKATFRSAWKHGQRCVIPAVGYYEWKKEGQSKQPYFIKPTQHMPMFLGGLYEPHRNGIPASCTIITHPASTILSPLHPRTPTMIHPKDITKWLDGSEDLITSSEVSFTPVSSAVNNAKNDGSELINPL